ncbi:MAG: glycosyltransferase family 39 protein [Xanthobacteraceae bacterium]
MPTPQTSTGSLARHSGGSSQRRIDGLAIAILTALAVVVAFTFRDYGLGWDDYTHSEYGDLLLSLYGSGFSDQRALSFVNLYMYGGGFDMLAALAAKVLPFDHFETRRLIGAVIGLIGLMVTWRLGRRLGGSMAGLVALILLAICPLYYGHMFINPKDAPFAVAMVVLLLGMVRAAQEYPQPQPATVALVGLGLGLTVGTRVIGGISGFYALGGVGFILVVEAATLGVRGAAQRLGRFLVCLLPGIILAYLMMGMVWPWSVVEPLNPLRAVEYFSHFFEKPWKEMFDGALLPVPDMPRSYVPTLFVLEIPEVLLALGLGGIAGVFVTLTRRDVPVQQRAALLMVALAATLPIAFTVITRPAMYNGIRHFVFVTPPLAALGGWAGAWLLARVQAIGRPALAAAAAVLLGLAALPAIDMVRLHPYQYTHFNQFAGGIRAADERYMIDYWGLAFKQAAQQLRARLVERLEVPTGGHWRIAVCGPHAPAQVELGPEFQTTWDSKGADFALMLGEFYCRELNAPVLVEIAREGVVYARVYDIRAHSVLSLFTIPPIQ